MAADGSPDSYTWEMFFEANIAAGKRPVFECGGYHMYDAAGIEVTLTRWPPSLQTEDSNPKP
jgi:hypothetical protein